MQQNPAAPMPPPAMPPAFAPSPAFAQPPSAAVEWNANSLRKTSVLRGIVFLAITAFNFLVIYLNVSVGRTPSIIVLALTPFFLVQGSLPFIQRKRIPIRTGTSWDAVHFDIPDGLEAHPIAGISKTAARFSLNAGFTFQINAADGRVIKYHGISAIRARELKAFVERRQSEFAAIAAGAPPQMYANVAGAPGAAPWPGAVPGMAPAPGAMPGAPPASAYPAFAAGRPTDTGPTAAWNSSVLASGAAIPDTTVTQARGSLAQNTGLWLSTDSAMLKKQATMISVVLIIFPVLMILNIGGRSRMDFGLLVGIGLAIGAVLVVAVQMAMRKSMRGEEGAAFMMLPPTLTSATAVEAVVADAAAKAGKHPVAPARRRMEVSWQIGPTMTVKASQGTDGQVRHIALRSKGKENLEAHKRFKGAVLEALGAPSGAPVPMMVPPPPPAPPFPPAAPPA